MTAIFPGSFDPVTLGHLDLILRSARMFDTLIVAVLINPAKSPVFSAEERISMLRTELEVNLKIPEVQVETFSGLLAEFAKDREAQYILRGVRSSADATYEIPMAQANMELLDGLETVILVADPVYSYVSASLIREIAGAGYKSNFDDSVLNQWVTPDVKEMLKRKYL